jgi:AcrR family transcriptional regulator
VNDQSPTRRRLKGHERREQLLTVSIELAEAEGLNALTMERVASRADISKPVLYSHFKNRGDLLLAILTQYWEDIDSRVRARLEAAVTPLDQVDALIEGYFDAVAEAGPVLHQLLVDTSQEPEVERARRARHEAAERAWSSVYKKNWKLDAEVAEVLAALLRGALESAASYWLRSGSVSRETCVAVCSAAFRGSLAEVVGTAKPRRRTTKG